jgi:ABC-2 type transport system permease protein
VIGLISSEWLRMRSRRLVKALAVLALLGIVAAVVIGGVQSSKPNPADLARAERQAERFYTDCIAQDDLGVAEPDFDLEAFCREQADPSSFLSPTPLQLSEMPDILRGTAFLAILIGLVIGASAIGASWQTGTMTTILSWEPRRARVLLVRAAIVALAVIALVVILLGIFVALFWFTTSVRGLTTTPSGWTRELAGVVARIASLAGAASIIGGAIAMLGRNTAAALGAVFVYLALLEGIVRGLRPALGRFLLGDNIATVVIGHDVEISSGFDGHAPTTITLARAALVVGIYALGLLALAAASFRARDVQ